MSIPFYYSFSEFKNNYNYDLEKWLNTHPDGDEKDFLDCLYQKYKPYFGFSKDGEFREFKDKEIKVYFHPNQIPRDSMGYYPNDCDEDDFGVYRYMTTEDIIEEINYRWVNIEYDNSSYLTTLGVDSADDIDNIKITDNLNLILLMAKFKIFDEVDNKGRIIELSEGNGDKHTSDYLITARVIKELDLYYKFNELVFCGIIQPDEVKYQNFKLSIPKFFHFIQEKLNPTTPPTKTQEVKTLPPTQEVTEKPTRTDEVANKIPINGNYQMLCFLFSELINKGYITAPMYNGKISHRRTAEMLLNHFEFTNNPEQPTVDNLTAYIKDNRYSLDKQNLFNIPKMKNAND